MPPINATGAVTPDLGNKEPPVSTLGLAVSAVTGFMVLTSPVSAIFALRLALLPFMRFKISDMPILLVMLVGARVISRGSAQGEGEGEQAIVAGDIDTGAGGGACLDTGDIPKSTMDRVPLIGTGTGSGFSLDCAFPLPSTMRAEGALRDLSCVGGRGSGSDTSSGRCGVFSDAGVMCFGIILGVCEGVGGDVK
jgi:hypothetical protein